MARLLLFSVFVIATCGLIYELVAGALASYLLGDSITQFSTVIGTYLFSMGIGSFLSKFVKKGLVGTFIRVEILIGLIGGFSAAVLFILFEFVSSFKLVLYGQVGITGILVGLEIPLLMRILKDEYKFEDLVSNIFTFDYIGALLASILFPLVLVPHLGLIRTAMLFGLMNVAVAIWSSYVFEEKLRGVNLLRGAGIVSLLALLAGFVYSDSILSFAEGNAYPDTIIHAQTTPYQRIVLTRHRESTRLYLNGNLQFDSKDEYRYHEALIHPGLAAVEKPKKVLVLGGGDGFAMREILKYPGIEAATLVDLDPAMNQLFGKGGKLQELNQQALSDPRVTVINADAFAWIRECKDQFDFIAIDFPDPVNFSVGKLYTRKFYEELQHLLAPGAIAVVQSTSPFVAPKAFWCVESTIRSAGFHTIPYHAYVPSFGEWGYIMAMNRPWTIPDSFPQGLRYVNDGTLAAMLQFPEDMKAREVEVNQLNNQVLVGYFEEEWAHYGE